MRSVPRALVAKLIPYGAGIIALGIGCYQLGLPHVLSGVLGWNLGYDDGVYSGASIRLVHGVLPYRDFTFVAPPGIAYILAPFSALGMATGSNVALVLDRCLTVVVVAANPVLAGLLVRRLGRLAMAVSAFSLALWPLAVSVDRGVELEPYLVFFVLLAGVVLFGARDDPGRRSLIVSGLVLGCAVVTKAWAVLPAAGAFVVLAPRWRRGGQWLALGVVAAVIVACAPFLATAPHAFIHDVIVDQLNRQNTLASTPLGARLASIAGTTALSAFFVPGSAAIAAFVVVAVLSIGVFALDFRHHTRLEWYILAAAVITFAGMFDSAVLYDHYAYFPAAMLAPLLGVVAYRIKALVSKLAPFSTGATSERNPAGEGRRRLRRPAAALTFVGALALVSFLVQQDTFFAGNYLSEASGVSQLTRYIPAGTCVISDFPSDLIAAGRFTPSRSGCPAVVDPYGMYLADDGGSQPHLIPPAIPVSFQYLWLDYLQRADYVELRIPFSDFIPWSSYMIRWFSANYRLVVHLRTVYSQPFIDTHKDIYLYKRIA